MKFTALVENTNGENACTPQHGLSILVETKKHRLLMDTGAGSLLIDNAKALKKDLSTVDTVILSHGHYDHGGGLPFFVRDNNHAKIFVNENAFKDYYSLNNNLHYIGLDKEIEDYLQLIKVNGNLKIDDELSLFSGIEYVREMPFSNRKLKVDENGELKQDYFEHEQCLVIESEGKKVLLSGCAHHGIINILEQYRKIYGGDPDYVFSGFHLMKKDDYSEEEAAEIRSIAESLCEYKTIFYTCHCTGEAAYDIMKKIMCDRIQYFHCGDEVII